MTIKEFIEKLKEFDENLEVFYYDDDFGDVAIKQVEQEIKIDIKSKKSIPIVVLN